MEGFVKFFDIKNDFYFNIKTKNYMFRPLN